MFDIGLGEILVLVADFGPAAAAQAGRRCGSCARPQ
jgi:hypothetical protein